MDSRQRTVIKALMWNVIGLLMMCLVGRIMTGSLAVGGTMAIVNTAIGLVTYCLYERFWAGVSWGRRQV